MNRLDATFIGILLTACTSAVNPPATRPAIETLMAKSAPATEACDPPGGRSQEIYQDAEYRFVARGFGSGSEQTEPGLFVQSLSRDRWRKITRVGLANATLGRSPTREELAEHGDGPMQVGWDFSAYRGRDAIAVPLRTGGSIMFPDSIELDRERDSYLLYFGPRNYPGTRTKLEVPRRDLAEQFGDRP